MTKSSENTQIALLQLTMQQVQKDMSNMASDIKDIRTNKYVTQNEMQMAISEALKQTSIQISTVADRIDSQTKIWSIIGSTILVALVATFMKGILRI